LFHILQDSVFMKKKKFLINSSNNQQEIDKSVLLTLKEKLLDGLHFTRFLRLN